MRHPFPALTAQSRRLITLWRKEASPPTPVLERATSEMLADEPSATTDGAARYAKATAIPSRTEKPSVFGHETAFWHALEAIQPLRFY